MPDPLTIFTVVFLGILGTFVYRYLKAGSLVGTLLGGRIRETVGETTLEFSAGGSTVLRVQILDTGKTEPVIALSITRKAVLGASVTPFRLTRGRRARSRSCSDARHGHSDARTHARRGGPGTVCRSEAPLPADAPEIRAVLGRRER